jgi:hypothetical protein
MRSRINLFAFTVTLVGAGAGQMGHPTAARATVAPTTIEWMYCCYGQQTRCCGNNWCAITPRGCATG